MAQFERSLHKQTGDVAIPPGACEVASLEATMRRWIGKVFGRNRDTLEGGEGTK